MKKIILLTVVLTVITGMAVFANGEQEGDFTTAVRPWNPSGEQPEILSLSGELQLAYDEPPVLEADGEEYILVYPPFLDDGLKLDDGEAVEVEGFLVPGFRKDWDPEGTYLRLTKAVVDGEEYDLAQIMYDIRPMPGGPAGKMARRQSGGCPGFQNGPGFPGGPGGNFGDASGGRGAPRRGGMRY